MTFAAAAIALTFASCKKDKKTEPAPGTPPVETPTPPEVITTLRVYIWDSLANTQVTGSPFTLKDPDGDNGGQPAAFLNNGADSVITLAANKTYLTRVVILDETSNPVDSTSNDIEGDEGYEHMLFYNGNPANNGNSDGNTILNSLYPNYTVKLNGSNIIIRYLDADNGPAHSQPTRHIGLRTVLRTSAATIGKYPFITTLRHQPDAKDGSYAPGETDIEVRFKVQVN